MAQRNATMKDKWRNILLRMWKWIRQLHPLQLIVIVCKPRVLSMHKPQFFFANQPCHICHLLCWIFFGFLFPLWSYQWFSEYGLFVCMSVQHLKILMCYSRPASDRLSLLLYITVWNLAISVTEYHCISLLVVHTQNYRWSIIFFIFITWFLKLMHLSTSTTISKPIVNMLT